MAKRTRQGFGKVQGAYPVGKPMLPLHSGYVLALNFIAHRADPYKLVVLSTLS